MAKKYSCLVLLLLIITTSCTNKPQPEGEENYDQVLETRMNVIASFPVRRDSFPRSIDKSSNLIATPANKWTSGFFPGNLWLSYDYTGDVTFKNIAEEWMPLIVPQQHNTKTHDIGFMIYCSVGQAYRITGDKAYEPIIIQAAKSLATRYSDKLQVIKSFDKADWHPWDYSVIIDNMMNLELLYAATNLTGDQKYANIASTHAKTTIRNHYRDDFSSYHVVNYNEASGEIIKKETFQGYSDESAWSRGQAWGLYGYTVCYRETKDEEFLTQAEGIANFMMNHPNTPEDKIPYWDYNAPNIPNAPRDASAAAVMASALIELGRLTSNNSYINYAREIVKSLNSKNYLLAANDPLPFILDHSTGFLPEPGGTEIDVPLVYADYYFLEALNRLKDK